jgi:hypothetical protein
MLYYQFLSLLKVHQYQLVEFRLLECYNMWLLEEPTFQRNVGSYKSHMA